MSTLQKQIGCCNHIEWLPCMVADNSRSQWLWGVHYGIRD